MSSGSHLFLIPVFLAAACFAEDATPAKPECNAENLHKIWPEKTSRRPGAPVEICVEKHHLRYRWQPLTVDISELRALAKSNGKVGKEPAPSAGRE
jgi:hypothetical protein